MPNVVRVLLCFLLLAMTLTALGGAKAVSAAGNPPAAQTYYISMPESQALTVFQAITATSDPGVTRAASPIETYVSIAIADDATLVYYDQWENGYDPNLTNPTDLYDVTTNPDGVQIWGNGNAADGAPPGFASDVLNAGDVIVLNSSVDTSTPDVVDFDGRDKVGASDPIALSRAAWPVNTNALLAFAHELYPTNMWGTSYQSPVGTDTPGSEFMFEYSGLTIMASQDDTAVSINGTPVATLSEGQAYLAEGITQGATVTSDKPVQVQLLTGDLGSYYEARDMTLFPVESWTSSYWSPVGVTSTIAAGSTPTRLWLYNPTGTLYLKCQRRSVADTYLTIAANGVGTVDVANYSGAHCFAVDAPNSTGVATDHPFFGVGTIDTATSALTESGVNFDWSFTLIPDAFLTPQVLIGLGLGYDPTAGSVDNGSPVWISPTCQTWVYVDWNNDGTPDLADLNGDGDTTDTVDGILESTSNNGMNVAALQSVRLFNPTVDNQTGARVYSRAAQGGSGPGCNLAAAWGEDPSGVISADQPGLDVGTTVPPLPLLTSGKNIALAPGGDKDGDGVISPGDTAIYTIQIHNIGALPISNVMVYDEVPAHMTYVDGTTTRDIGGAGPVQIPDDVSGTPFPLDALPNGVDIGTLGADQIGLVSFNVVLDQTIDVNAIENCGVVRAGGMTINSCVDIELPADWGDLPDSYDTTSANGGPRHSGSQLMLGSVWDGEADGQPSVGADGDDLNPPAGPDDEDGVAAVGVWSTGAGQLHMDVAGGPGCLNVWMDFTDDAGAIVNPDGNFVNANGYDSLGGISEQVVVNQLMANGASTVSFPLPSGLFPAPNGYYVRVRLSPTDAAAPTCTAAIGHKGFVAGGEVEDYHFTFKPNAVTLTKLAAGPATPIWLLALASLLALFAALALPLVKRAKI